MPNSSRTNTLAYLPPTVGNKEERGFVIQTFSGYILNFNKGACTIKHFTIVINYVACTVKYYDSKSTIINYTSV